MQYSPKLKKAMEQMKTILQENDITGIVVLHTPGYSEYLHHLEASYSCAKIVPHGIEFRIKTSEVGPEKAKALAEGSYNMMTHFCDFFTKYVPGYLDSNIMLERLWKGIQGPGNRTSHTQQNN